MSDTVKLIIEIPEDTAKEIKDNAMFAESIASQIKWDVTSAIVNGIPLDDVKAEIEKAKWFHVGTFENDNPIDYGIVEGFDKAIAILDSIGKGDSE